MYTVLKLFPEVQCLSSSSFAFTKFLVIRLWAEIEIDSGSSDPVVGSVLGKETL